MKRIIILLTFFLSTSCVQKTESQFEYKKWHESPNRSPLSSTVYPFVKWENVVNIKKGLTQENAGFVFQYYHHSVNAIIFTKSPQNEDYEIALKLSEDKNKIIDISYFKLEKLIK